MKAVYIESEGKQVNFEKSLNNMFTAVYRVRTVVDGIGKVRDQGIEFAFIHDNILDMSLKQAMNVIGKMEAIQQVFIISDNPVPGEDEINNWIQLPIEKQSLSMVLGINDDPVESLQDMKLNLKRLVDISSGDKSFIRDILNTFLRDVNHHLEDLTFGLKQQNVLNVGHAAHKLKSPLNLVGVHRLDEHLEYIDDLSIHKRKSTEVDWSIIAEKVELISTVTNKAKELVAESDVDALDLG